MRLFWSSLSSILSVLSFNWFFVEPLYSLTVYKQGYPFTLLLMLVVALMSSNLMIRLKKQADTSMKKRAPNGNFVRIEQTICFSGKSKTNS
ncbi:DUF4118 domain-containing protein [Enterococcus faecalis]